MKGNITACCITTSGARSVVDLHRRPVHGLRDLVGVSAAADAATAPCPAAALPASAAVSVGAADAAMVIVAPWHAGFGLLLLGLCINNIKPEERACM
jgi:hypothetical protein